nr:MAG TPA: hypothetical protein [Caudoviricetes sp.]
MHEILVTLVSFVVSFLTSDETDFSFISAHGYE